MESQRAIGILRALAKEYGDGYEGDTMNLAADCIAELEKENAALKSRLKTLRKYVESDDSDGSYYIPLDECEPAAALYDDVPPNA